MPTANLISSFKTQRDTHVADGKVAGLRENGCGDITLAGTCGTINQTYLYWHGPTHTAGGDALSGIRFRVNLPVGALPYKDPFPNLLA